MLATLIPIALGYVMNHLFVNVTWNNLLIKGLIFVFAYLIAEYFIAMNPEERAIITHLFHSKMKKEHGK